MQPPPGTPTSVRASASFQALEPDELSFAEGDTVDPGGWDENTQAENGEHRQREENSTSQVGDPENVGDGLNHSTLPRRPHRPQ